MRGSIVHFLAGAALAVLAACASAERPAPGDLGSGLPSAEAPRLSWPADPGPSAAVRVVDGDSLEIAGQDIRLHGIDAPEDGQTCRDTTGRSWDCGRAAEQRLAALVSGRTPACRGIERDRYGRLVAVCEAGGTDLGAAMVASGLAVAYRRYSHAYVTEETDARNARRGMWAGSFETPEDWRAARRSRAVRRAAAQPSPTPGCAIKGNISSSGRIYHVPGSRWYDRTVVDPADGERWFCSAAEAESAGWRAPRG